MFAEVIVDISHSEADKIFEYSFEDCRIVAGSRVLVPFGGKTIEGIVIKTKDYCNFDENKVKPIISLLEETPALTKETLALSDFISRGSEDRDGLRFRRGPWSEAEIRVQGAVRVRSRAQWRLHVCLRRTRKPHRRLGLRHPRNPQPRTAAARPGFQYREMVLVS